MLSIVDQKVWNPQDTPDSQLGSEQGRGDVACGSYQGPVIENDPNSPLSTVNGRALGADKVRSAWSRASPGKQPRKKVDLKPSKEKLTGNRDSMLAAEQETPGNPHSVEQEQEDVGGTLGVVVVKGTILDADKTQRPQKPPRRAKPSQPESGPEEGSGERERSASPGHQALPEPTFTPAVTKSTTIPVRVSSLPATIADTRRDNVRSCRLNVDRVDTHLQRNSELEEVERLNGELREAR